MSSRSRNTSPEIWDRVQSRHAGNYCPAAEGKATEAQWNAILRSTWNILLGFGLPPMHHMAESWMEWGEPVTISEAVPGDTVILRVNGRHIVALWQAWEGDSRVKVFGGTAPAMIESSDHPRTAIRGIRRLRL